MKIFKKKEKKQSDKRKEYKKVLVLTIIICFLLLTITLWTEEEAVEVKAKENREVKRIITVENVLTKNNVAKIKLLGEAVPEWQTVLKGRVDGAIEKVSPNFRVGSNVKKGEILLHIENSQYKAIVAEAKVRLANAENTLLMIKNEVEEAKENWKRSGFEGEPKSKLVFKEPQLKIAENEVKAAEAALIKANLDLEYTKVRAPFNAVVIERHINLGGNVFTGEPLATVYSTNKNLVKVNVDQKQWNIISNQIDEVKVKLTDNESKNSWYAKIARVGSWINRDNRLRPIIIEVNDPLKLEVPLLAGTFLNVELIGGNLNNTLAISESALTKGGLVWYVTKDNLLQSYKPEIHFYSEGIINISVPDNNINNLNIAVNPNSTYMNGFKVKPHIINDGE